jgi:tRNA nucleotidyltransferase (CCA-adding enzyme)
MGKILDEVLVRVKPDGTLRERTRLVLSELEHRITELKTTLIEKDSDEKTDFTIIHVGSTAKGTELTTGDIDLFLGFDPGTPESALKRITFSIGEQLFDEHEIKYAEHPYIRGIYHGMEVDLVPCYRVESGDMIQSAVDRTPFHTQYILEHLSDDQKDDVRLLKAFLKGIGCYGAENKTMGFSGYLCELLVLRYGTFAEVLQNVCRWEHDTFIDLEGTGYLGPKHGRTFIVVDPVDPGRNVASPVSAERIAGFIHASRHFLEHPSISFFFPAPREMLDRKDIEGEVTQRGEIIGMEFRVPDTIDDILYPQLRLTMERLRSLIKDHGFELNDDFHMVSDGRIYLILEFRVSRLPDLVLHRGPTVYNANHEARFLDKWGERDPFLVGDRWFVHAPAKFRTARDLLDSKLPTLQTGRHIMKAIASGTRILDSEDIPLEVLSAFIDRRMPWEW